MAGVRRSPNPNGKYQAWFIDANGKQRFVTGTRNKKNSLEIAQRLEDEHRQIRLGYRPAPTSVDKQQNRPVTEVIAEYLSWGETQGGWRGKPWSKMHARNRRTQLRDWCQHLGLQTQRDLNGILPRVEQCLRGLLSEGKSGKTLSNRAEGLKAFCDWCVQRGMLADNPLKALAPFDTSPRLIRRAMTIDI